MSWDSLHNEPEIITEPLSEEDKLVAKVLSTSDGQKLLDLLKKKTLDQPSFYPGEDASYGYIREGQNSIVRELVQKLDRVRNQ